MTTYGNIFFYAGVVTTVVLGGWFQCSGWQMSKQVKYSPILFGASRQLSTFAGVPSYIRVVFCGISRTFARLKLVISMTVQATVSHIKTQ